jgi:hypothetical protein
VWLFRRVEIPHFCSDALLLVKTIEQPQFIIPSLRPLILAHLSLPSLSHTRTRTLMNASKSIKKTMPDKSAEPDNAVSSLSKSKKRREKDAIKVKKSTGKKAPKMSKRDVKKASKNPLTTVESTVTVTSTVHAPHQESRILTATFQEQVVPAKLGRPTDTRELLALAAAADHQNALQRMRQQEEMIIRSRMEQEMEESVRAHQLMQQMRAEQEFALVAAHQRQQAGERNMAVHNMAVNALTNGHSLDDILLRSGLPQELGAEVAERMFALSQQLMAQQQGPDALTLALLQEQQNMQVANALRLRGQFP